MKYFRLLFQQIKGFFIVVKIYFCTCIYLSNLLQFLCKYILQKWVNVSKLDVQNILKRTRANLKYIHPFGKKIRDLLQERRTA